MKNKYLLYSGFVAPVLFWTTIIICGFIIGDYRHTSRLVSELGAIGTKTQYIFTIGLVLSSIFSVLFIIGLYKICKKVELNIIPILIITSFSFSLFGAALFPLPLKLHGIIGTPSIIMPLSPLLSLLLWGKEKISDIKYISVIAFLIMSLGFFIFTPNILSDYSGLKQRIFHIGWTFWFIYLSNKFIKLRLKNY